MKRLKSYFKMKYEMFLMTLYDYIYKLLQNTRSDWYPDYVVNRKDQDRYFDKWIQAEREASNYTIQLLRKDEYIYYLEQKLDLYENEEDAE